MGRKPQHAAIAWSEMGIADRISIINAQLDLDRQEVRSHQNALLQLCYVLLPAFIAVFAFYVGHPEYKSALIVGDILLLALFVVVYLVTMCKWLRDARACQHIREVFYMNGCARLFGPAFDPLRAAKRSDRVNSVRDPYLWFPFAVTVAAGLVSVAFILLGKPCKC